MLYSSLTSDDGFGNTPYRLAPLQVRSAPAAGMPIKNRIPGNSKDAELVSRSGVAAAKYSMLPHRLFLGTGAKLMIIFNKNKSVLKILYDLLGKLYKKKPRGY